MKNFEEKSITIGDLTVKTPCEQTNFLTLFEIENIDYDRTRLNILQLKQLNNFLTEIINNDV